MAFMMREKFATGVNILASEVGLTLKTRQGTQAMATDEDGYKIIKAGTVFPANDGTAEGIVFEDVDITNDTERPISVIIAGRVIEDNLPVAVAEEAKTALQASGIHFDKEVR